MVVIQLMKDNVVTPFADVKMPDLIQPGVLHMKTTGSNLTHAPLVNPRTYYRSKIVTSQAGVNPLTAAAAGLLTFIAQLQVISAQLNGSQTYQDLMHEMKAFETQAQASSYRSENILLARYILCTTLDELLLHSNWGPQLQWHKHKLLVTFHGEDWGGERFFVILERLSADSTLHVDLLELIYLCLSLGYKGKFRFIEDGQTQLDEVTEKLYHTIRWLRGDFRKDLAIADPLPVAVAPAPQTTTTTSTQPLPIWLLGIFTAMLMLTVYTGFSFMLSSSVTPVVQQLNSILQNYAES